MTNDTKWEELRQEEELAYFRADVCLYSPESYTLDEKKAICNDMVATSQATLAAMREDFQGYPPEIQERLLGMLSMSGVESPQLCSSSSLSTKRSAGFRHFARDMPLAVR